jgi:hypothetical protein
MCTDKRANRRKRQKIIAKNADPASRIGELKFFGKSVDNTGITKIVYNMAENI